MKVFYPTAEEFSSPVTYIERLYQQGAAKYGSVKIVPPKEAFTTELKFDIHSDQKIPYRY
jgi:hypothetical protein